MANFSFPTVDLPGVGPCVTRRVLVERTGISATNLAQFQQNLVKDHDYFYLPNPSGSMACNYYRISVIQRLAQAFPTLQAQQMAQEVTAFMSASYASAPALPSGNSTYHPKTVQQPEPAYSQPYEVYGQSYREPHHDPDGYGVFLPQRTDLRIAALGSAIAHHLQSQIPHPQPPAMTQAELLQAARTIQSDAVGYMERGFQLAATAQSQTAEAIRHARPTITHHTTNHTDNRAYTLFEFLEQKLNGLSQLQFGLLASGVFCVVAMLCYTLLSMSQSPSPQSAPTSRHNLVEEPISNG